MYVQYSCYGGISHQDMETFRGQITFNGEFFIAPENVENAIVDYLLEMYPYIPRVELENAIANKTMFEFELLNRVEDDDGNISYECGEKSEINGVVQFQNTGTFNGDTMFFVEDYWYGQGHYETRFYIDDIAPENVWYFVEEMFSNPYKYVDIIERLYVPPFEDLDAAKAYLEEMPTHETYKCRGEKKILVADRTKLVENDWLMANLEAQELMKEKGVDILHESYAPSVDGHLENLKKL